MEHEHKECCNGCIQQQAYMCKSCGCTNISAALVDQYKNIGKCPYCDNYNSTIISITGSVDATTKKLANDIICKESIPMAYKPKSLDMKYKACSANKNIYYNLKHKQVLVSVNDHCYVYDMAEFISVEGKHCIDIHGVILTNARDICNELLQLLIIAATKIK